MRNNKWLWPVYSKIYDMLLDMPLYRALINEVVDALRLQDADALLDAGCGTGNLEIQVSSLSLRNLKIEAIDRSSEMLEIALTKNPGDVRFLQVDLDKDLPFATCYFDRIALIHVLYAVSEPMVTLKELYRLLRAKGRIVIVNPCKKASANKVIIGNLKLIKPMERPFFLVRMSLVMLLNTLIAHKAQRGQFHFWDAEDCERVLRSIGFSIVSMRASYADQSLLIVAEKE